MTVAFFDLDNTLLAGDSDYLWSQYLLERGAVDIQHHAAENARFMAEYEQGRLDVREFLRFQLRPLSEHPLDTLLEWRADYVQRVIEPIILPAGERLLDEHRDRGHTVVIATSTNAFITAPIAERLKVSHLIATEPEFNGQAYTGEVVGEPCYRAGKVMCAQRWLQEHGETLEESWFYSDSHNDLPLLEQVAHPVAVDPDPTLRAVAQQHGWRILSLRASHV